MEFDTQKYKVWKLPHPLLLHWVVNPGLAFNELVLGQRLPKVTLIDKVSDAPLMERQYVPCPHCDALNDSRIWSKSHAFGHWFGYLCPECHGKIPCLWNISSLIILVLTFPIWGWFKNVAEAKWLKQEKQRLSTAVSRDPPGTKKIKWLKMGLGWGAIMFGVMVLPDVFRGDLRLGEIAFQGAIWLSGGFMFGLIMKLILARRP